MAKTGAPLLVFPTATNKPDELAVTPFMLANVVDPFINAGVVQVDPSGEVAKRGTPEVPFPIATNRPDALTQTDFIFANADEPFINAGVVQVDPSEEVA